jgi:5-amino-6-(D-ribitylamino)uracil---L-tyrosine 4-hydroxyphenyl transferase
MRHPWDEFSKEQQVSLDSVLDGKDLNREQALGLVNLRPRQILSLSLVADELRQQHCGDAVSYVVNRNVNFTNVCIKSCRFCAFSRDHRDQEGYYLETDQILSRIAQAEAFGATEVCIQAGLPPKMDGAFYVRLTRAVKERFPEMHLHAFSPEEVLYGAVRSRCSTAEYLQELKEAGLDTMPGTSAEVLEQGLRDRLAPGRITVDQWKEIVSQAHKIGLRTTSTMMFGHIEQESDWVDHMLTLREMQFETGGFTEFVPLGFVHQDAPMSFMKEMSGYDLGPSGHNVLHVHALARILLGRTFRNIQASWVKEGEKLAALLLGSGCNDLGGTLINESISTAAGASHGQFLSPRQIRTLIRSAGRQPVQRNTVYESIRSFTEDEQDEALDRVEHPEELFGSYRALTVASDHRFVHPNRLAGESVSK